LRSFSKLKFLEFKGGAPGLDLETDPVDMESTFTPSAYGLNIDVENRLGAGTIPTGTVQSLTMPLWHLKGRPALMGMN